MKYGVAYREFITSFHSVNENLKCWSTCFVPLGDPAYWPKSHDLPFVPNAAWKWKKRRPRSTHIRNEMDDRNSNVGSNFCMKCGVLGHNTMTCG